MMAEEGEETQVQVFGYVPGKEITISCLVGMDQRQKLTAILEHLGVL